MILVKNVRLKSLWSAIPLDGQRTWHWFSRQHILECSGSNLLCKLTPSIGQFPSLNSTSRHSFPPLQSIREQIPEPNFCILESHFQSQRPLFMQLFKIFSTAKTTKKEMQTFYPIISLLLSILKWINIELTRLHSIWNLDQTQCDIIS